jgi:hypothetical protein
MRERERCRYWMCDWVRRPGQDGRCPDFPDKSSYLLLADTQAGRSAIFECDLSVRRAKGRRIRPLAPDFCDLIDSAMRYPPALALARDDVKRALRGTRTRSRQALVDAYAAALWRRLAAQTNAPYLLARACSTEIGYLDPGDWYWVLAVEGTPPSIVAWVSGDFFVYRNPIADFELDEGQIRRLSRFATAFDP